MERILTASTDPKRHNYLKKIERLERAGKLNPRGFTRVNVSHDSWCEIYRGGCCNCDPDIKVNGRVLA